MSRIATALRAVVWLAVALLFSAGAAGIVSGMDHIPGSAARAELTWAGDRAALAAMGGVEDRLRALQQPLDELGVQGRGALAALTGQDLETVRDAVDAGSALVSAIRAQSTRIRADLAAVPGVIGSTSRLTTSDEVRARHALMTRAAEATDGLGEAWARLAAGAPSAARLAELLTEHDRVMGEALAEGRAARYRPAIEKIEEASAVLEEARQVRNGLANTVDVTTLDEWIARNQAYEDALRRLYDALRQSGGRVTAAVREALDAHDAARDRLPPDTRGLIVIMGEIGLGGLNGAVITIEEARGALAAALDDLDGAATGG